MNTREDIKAQQNKSNNLENKTSLISRKISTNLTGLSLANNEKHKDKMKRKYKMKANKINALLHLMVLNLKEDAELEEVLTPVGEGQSGSVNPKLGLCQPPGVPGSLE